MNKVLGVIINPWAGLGGRVGLKGSDGPDIVERALALGGKPEASTRAEQALALIADMDELPRILTYGGDMGEIQLKDLKIPAEVIGRPAQIRSTGQDTQDAAKKMLDAGCDLILFAGGDGTARDLCAAVGNKITVIGIPAGVKIHSAVYAINPRSAGQLAVDYLEGRISHLISAPVLDIDEEKFRQGQVQAKQYGEMLVPWQDHRMQCCKSSLPTTEEERIGMAQYAVDIMEPDTLYFIGPGSTTQAIMDDLGLPNTLLGVDAVKNKQLVASDLNEQGILSLLDKEDRPAKLIVTIIGGQGNLFGRGNQQFSPTVLRRIGKKNILVVSTANKLLNLGWRPLLVDTGDPELDRELCGYTQVLISYEQYMMHKIACE